MAVFSWGANSHGQLGLGFDSELCLKPQRIAKLPFNANAIKSIKGGGGHVIVLDNSGNLFSCGWNNRGQLGLDSCEDKNELNSIPSEYFNDAKIHKFACGWDISGAITSDNKLFVWGSNNFQQLGLCHRGFNIISRPMQLNLPCDEIPVNISFGLRHCSVLTENNKIYIFGKLRIIDIHNYLKVTRISFNKTEIIKIQCEYKIKSIKSGQNHLIIIVQLNGATQLIGIGNNKFGQSTSFESDEKITTACAGWSHNGILTEKQHIFLWGRNTYGQIGGNDISKDSYHMPNKLSIPDNMVPVSFHLGSEHGLVVTSPLGKVFTWGWNEHGNCGNDSTENLFYPKEIDLPSACKIAGTGSGFCYVVCEK